MIDQCLYGEYHIVGVEGLAVAPCNAVAQLERPGIELIVGCEALASPGLDLTAVVVQDEEWLDHRLVEPVIPARRGWYALIPALRVLHAAAVDVEDHRLLSRGVCVFARSRGARGRCGGGGAGGGSGGGGSGGSGGGGSGGSGGGGRCCGRGGRLLYRGSAT